jgi:cytidine deaminase
MTDPSAARLPSVDLTTARDLLRRAGEARTLAYAPYSGFPVGAALLATDGRVYTGVNVENASYGLSTCAERTAVVRAMAEGARAFEAIAVVGPDDGLPCPPCGSCRQILHEIAPDLLVITSTETGEPGVAYLRNLLPFAFDGRGLPPRTRGR